MVGAFFGGLVLAMLQRRGYLDASWVGRIQNLPWQTSLLNGLAAMMGNMTYQVMSDWIGGASLGKLMLGIRVSSADGTPTALRGAIIRSLAGYVDFLLVGFVAYHFMEKSPLRQRLGDRWGNTAVFVASSLEQPAGARRVAAGILLGMTAVATVMVGLLVRAAMVPSVAEIANEANLDKFTESFPRRPTMIQAHYPAAFAAKLSGSDSVYVSRNAHGHEQYVVLAVVQKPISDDIEEVARVWHLGIDDAERKKGNVIVDVAEGSTTCFGAPGIERRTTRDIRATSMRYTSHSCTFLKGGHGYMFISGRPKADVADEPLLQRILDATTFVDDGAE